MARKFSRRVGIVKDDRLKGPVRISGPFAGTLQGGPARAVRGHGLSDEHLDRGMQYASKGFWDDAIREFQKSVDLTQDYSEGYNNLGVCYIYTERYPEAIEELTKALKYFPNWAVAMDNMALAYQRAGKYEEAINHYRQALTKNPKQPQIHEAIGEIQEALERVDEAEEAYRKAVELHRTYDLALYRLGMLLARRNKLEDAEGFLQRALEQDDSLAEAAGVLGAIRARRGDIQSAKQLFEKAQNVQPDDVPLAAKQGLMHLRYFEEVVRKNYRELEGAYEDPPSIAECMFNAGLAYFKAGKLGMARSSFMHSIEEDAQWAEPLIWVGMTDALDNKPAESRKSIEQAAKLDPENAMLMEVIAATWLSQGLHKEAERYLESAQKMGRAVNPLPEL